MDGESSFTHGLMALEQNVVRIVNVNVQKTEKITMERNSFDSVELSMDEEALGFKKGTSIAIKNQQSEKYKTITIEEPKGYFFRLSFD